MKDYTVVEESIRSMECLTENTRNVARVRFHKIFEEGYEQGFNDCRSELTEEEAKAHYDEGYKDGYEKGIHEVMTIDVFEGIKLAEYNKGYSAGYKDAYEVGKKDGQKAERMLMHEPLKKDLEEAYQKGLKHGQELRVKEAKCAEDCGMRRAWDVARKILSRHGEGYNATDKEVFGTDDVFSLSASEAVSKLEAWEKKQEQTEKSCENCGHYCGYDNQFKCNIKGLLCIEHDRWIPKQDAPETNVGSIEVGDECICNCPNKQKVVVTAVLERKDQEPWVTIMRKDGACYSRSSEGLTKTGNHYDIRGILDKMKESEGEEDGKRIK